MICGSAVEVRGEVGVSGVVTAMDVDVVGSCVGGSDIDGLRCGREMGVAIAVVASSVTMDVVSWELCTGIGSSCGTEGCAGCAGSAVGTEEGAELVRSRSSWGICAA